MLRMVVCRVLHPGRRLYNVSVGLHSGLSVGLYSGLTGYSFCGVKGSRSQGCRVCVFLLKGGEIQFLKRQSSYLWCSGALYTTPLQLGADFVSKPKDCGPKVRRGFQQTWVLLSKYGDTVLRCRRSLGRTDGFLGSVRQEAERFDHQSSVYAGVGRPLGACPDGDAHLDSGLI